MRLFKRIFNFEKKDSRRQKVTFQTIFLLISLTLTGFVLLFYALPIKLFVLLFMAITSLFLIVKGPNALLISVSFSCFFHVLSP